MAAADAETYRAVKRASDSFLGVPSQCFVASKAGVGQNLPTGKRLQYMGNLAMKINSKLGGINQTVASSLPWAEDYIVLGEYARLLLYSMPQLQAVHFFLLA